VSRNEPAAAVGIGQPDGDLVRSVPNPKEAIDREARQRVRGIFESAARDRRRFRRLNHYYYEELLRLLRFIIPPGRRVLEVGCADGYVLRELRPSFGLGIDFSGNMIRLARERTLPGQRANLRFVEADIESARFTEKFDYIVMSDLLGNLLDIQQALENVRSACHEETRVVVNYHSIMWEPLLRLAARAGLKMPSSHQNWISRPDMRNFLELSGYQVVKHQARLLAPVKIPLLSWFLNRVVARMPLLNGLCLTNILVARKRPRPHVRECSVSIVIPCRNERGRIREAVERLPRFGSRQEIIFVDGHSTDGTVAEIERVVREFPDRDIRLLHQDGKGKGDAVRLAFRRASGDVLMILDADLTVPPEDLPKFYVAIASGLGEFINGSRLVYPMEKQAMRFLNILGNKFFSVVLSWVLGQPLKDTLCGTKVICRQDYERIVAERDRFGDLDPFGDFDLLFGASKLGLEIVEVPVRYRRRTYGSTNIDRFRHGRLLAKMSLLGLRKFV
jgi:SAM-dependent methyltransferase